MALEGKGSNCFSINQLVSLLRSRYQGRHATLLPTNGCSRERHIPFPLFLRTNRMHVIVIGYANLASRKQPNKILLQRNLFLPAYSRRSDLRRISLPVVTVRFDQRKQRRFDQRKQRRNNNHNVARLASEAVKYHR